MPLVPTAPPFFATRSTGEGADGKGKGAKGGKKDGDGGKGKGKKGEKKEKKPTFEAMTGHPYPLYGVANVKLEKASKKKKK